MSVVTPQFLRVSPDDIARVGPVGACILALVRYVTSLPGESNGRRMADGSMWWRASHADMGRSLGGLPHDTVRRTLVKLKKSGDLLAMPAQEFYGDKAQAYRAPDQPLRESASGSDQPLRESASPITRKCVTSLRESASPGDAKVRHVPLFEELEEEGREGARRV